MNHHPWISFTQPVSLTELLVDLGGRCAAMLSEMTAHPVRPVMANQLRTIFLSKGVHGTTAIEGNTLTVEQMREIIETQKITTAPSKRQLQLEVLNLVDAYKYVQTMVQEQEPGALLTVDTICQVHRRVAQGLDHIRAVPGAIRTGRVVVGSLYLPPEGEAHLREQLGRLGPWLMGQRLAQSPMLDGLIRAVVAHVYLAWIHPFDDGNGRTSRTVELGLLMAAGVPFEGAVLMANHYNETRPIYMDRLARASREDRGNLTGFVEYALQGLHDNLEAALDLVRTETMRSAWENYVYDTFRTAHGHRLASVAARQRTLMLAISAKMAPLSRTEIEALPELARAYPQLPSKSLSRDIAACRKLDLLAVMPDRRLVARFDLMRAFQIGARPRLP